MPACGSRLASLAGLSGSTTRRLRNCVKRSAIVVRESFHRDGAMAELERTLVYTIADDRLFECWVYDQDQALVDRFLA